MKRAYSSIVKLTREFGRGGFIVTQAMTPLIQTTCLHIDNSRRDFNAVEFKGCIQETLEDEFQIEDSSTLELYGQRILTAIQDNKPQKPKHQKRFDDISIW